jgi:hypothetical protein
LVFGLKGRKRFERIAFFVSIYFTLKQLDPGLDGWEEVFLKILVYEKESFFSQNFFVFFGKF